MVGGLLAIKAARRQNALVVDASPQGRAFFEAVLTLLGYEVRSASNALEAFNLAWESPPDLIFLDSRLPGLREVSTRLRAVAGSPAVVLLGGGGPVPAWVDAVLSHRATWEEITGFLASLGVARERVQVREQALLSLARAVEVRDPYIQGHMERVGREARSLAAFIGLSAHEQEWLARAGLLHDVGKLGISPTILNKAGPFTLGEWQAVKEHPILGEHICQPLADPNVLQAVRYHHERYDGHGYPDGLAGEAVPLGARLLAVVDAYDALTSHRPHRQALSPWAALRVIMREVDGHFDPAVAFAFVEGVESGAIKPAPGPDR